MVHRVLVVGVDSIGERHVRCFAATGRARVSVCEVDAGSRRAVAERYAVAEAFADLGGREILDITGDESEYGLRV
jgi:predicted dehydrogenase